MSNDPSFSFPPPPPADQRTTSDRFSVAGSGDKPARLALLCAALAWLAPPVALFTLIAGGIAIKQDAENKHLAYIAIPLAIVAFIVRATVWNFTDA